MLGARLTVVELLIAVSPDEDSRLPHLLRIPLGHDELVFRTSGTLPRTKALYCHPVPDGDWPDDPVVDGSWKLLVVTWTFSWHTDDENVQLSMRSPGMITRT